MMKGEGGGKEGEGWREREGEGGRGREREGRRKRKGLTNREEDVEGWLRCGYSDSALLRVQELRVLTLAPMSTGLLHWGLAPCV